MQENKHRPVLLQEVIRILNPKRGQTFIDVTIGYGGHSRAILEKISPDGKLLGIDQDQEALDQLEELSAEYPNLTLVKGNFSKIEKLAKQNGLDKVDVILADIGVSSYQLDTAGRGFSFNLRGPLDMRMDKQRKTTAADIVNNYDESELTDIFSRYGEERFSKTIAREIVRERQGKKFQTTQVLSELIKKIYRRKGLRGKIHPATRVFQALRIETNDELASLEKFLPQALDLLQTKGKLAVITFHSLEDRMVKNFFQEEAKGCICPPDYPVCKCGEEAKVKILTKKPIIASLEEVKENPRSRSAKLRVLEKI